MSAEALFIIVIIIIIIIINIINIIIIIEIFFRSPTGYGLCVPLR